VVDHEPAGRAAPSGGLTPDLMITTTEAALILRKSDRAVARWVDRGILRGGRPGDEVARLDPRLAPALAAELGIPEEDLAAAVERARLRLGGNATVRWSARWVDARHAVEMAVAAGHADLIPERWRHLIPATARHVAS